MPEPDPDLRELLNIMNGCPLSADWSPRTQHFLRTEFGRLWTRRVQQLLRYEKALTRVRDLIEEHQRRAEGGNREDSGR